MSSKLLQKTVIEPDLAEVLAILKQDIFASMNCVKVGQIQSFDVAKHTAQVQILFKRMLPDGTTASCPLLIDVPVVTLQGGGGALQFPIAAGDQCLLFFSDRRIDEWLQNGTEATPGSPRLHDMSDAIALVGVNAINSTLDDAPTNKVVLSYQGSKFELTSTGWNFVGDGGAEIDISSTIDLKAAAGAEITLDALVTLKNNTTSLLVVMDGLIDVIKTLQVNGPIPLTAASIAALEAYKVVMATLLG